MLSLLKQLRQNLLESSCSSRQAGGVYKHDQHCRCHRPLRPCRTVRTSFPTSTPLKIELFPLLMRSPPWLMRYCCPRRPSMVTSPPPPRDPPQRRVLPPGPIAIPPLQSGRRGDVREAGGPSTNPSIDAERTKWNGGTIVARGFSSHTPLVNMSFAGKVGTPTHRSVPHHTRRCLGSWSTPKKGLLCEHGPQKHNDVSKSTAQVSRLNFSSNARPQIYAKINTANKYGVLGPLPPSSRQQRAHASAIPRFIPPSQHVIAASNHHNASALRLPGLGKKVALAPVWCSLKSCSKDVLQIATRYLVGNVSPERTHEIAGADCSFDVLFEQTAWTRKLVFPRQCCGYTCTASVALIST